MADDQRGNPALPAAVFPREGDVLILSTGTALRFESWEAGVTTFRGSGETRMSVPDVDLVRAGAGALRCKRQAHSDRPPPLVGASGSGRDAADRHHESVLDLYELDRLHAALAEGDDGGAFASAVTISWPRLLEAARRGVAGP
jgi:hypothetical protein